MRKILLSFLFVITLVGCTHVSAQQDTTPIWKLYPTKNIWTFIKLNTSNGIMQIIQYSVDEDSSNMEVSLNDIPLVQAEEVKKGRFELYPTQNMYNFILLDQINGKSYQVQWSVEEKYRFVIPITK